MAFSGNSLPPSDTVRDGPQQAAARVLLRNDTLVVGPSRRPPTAKPSIPDAHDPRVLSPEDVTLPDSNDNLSPPTDNPAPLATQPASLPRDSQPSLRIDLAGLSLRNPVLNASGTFGYGIEYGPYVHPAELGAIVTKSLTALPRPGNPPYRTVETRSGVLNAIGIANIGVDTFLADKVPTLAGLGVPVIVSIAGHTIDDYCQVAAKLDAQPAIAGIELNISCPNTADGLDFGVTPQGVTSIVRAVRAVVRRAPLLVKLSPNVSDIAATAAAAIDAGADALSMINTLAGMVIDADSRRPVLGNVTGGLSGPAIKPVALRMVHHVYRKVARPAGIPIVGMGGIQFAHDAVEFLLAGATAVAIGTANFTDPQATLKIIGGLRDYLVRHGFDDVRQLTGALKLD